MGLFDFFKGPDFNEGIETYKTQRMQFFLM